MAVRPFDWRDITALNRCRKQSVTLDSARLLTRGPLLLPGALLSYLAPNMGIFTGVVNAAAGSDSLLIGQMMHTPGSPFAHLTFLAPDTGLEEANVMPMLDYLAALSGRRGALRLLADIDEGSQAFDALHQGGFAIFSRQRIWQLNREIPKGPLPTGWRAARGLDAIAVRSLYANLVPGLVQQVEPLAAQNLRGLVHYQHGDLLAYVELKYGQRGIWVQPFVHPDVEEVTESFADMVRMISNRHSRPVYVCIRSYQSWLEAAMEDLGAEAGPKQAVMVKHLAVQQKAARQFALPALEGGQAEISAPIVRSEIK